MLNTDIIIQQIKNINLFNLIKKNYVKKISVNFLNINTVNYILFLFFKLNNSRNKKEKKIVLSKINKYKKLLYNYYDKNNNNLFNINNKIFLSNNKLSYKITKKNNLIFFKKKLIFKYLKFFKKQLYLTKNIKKKKIIINVISLLCFFIKEYKLNNKIKYNVVFKYNNYFLSRKSEDKKQRKKILPKYKKFYLSYKNYRNLYNKKKIYLRRYRYFRKKKEHFKNKGKIKKRTSSFFYKEKFNNKKKKKKRFYYKKIDNCVYLFIRLKKNLVNINSFLFKKLAKFFIRYNKNLLFKNSFILQLENKKFVKHFLDFKNQKTIYKKNIIKKEYLHIIKNKINVNKFRNKFKILKKYFFRKRKKFKYKLKTNFILKIKKKKILRSFKNNNKLINILNIMNRSKNINLNNNLLFRLIKNNKMFNKNINKICFEKKLYKINKKKINSNYLVNIILSNKYKFKLLLFKLSNLKYLFNLAVNNNTILLQICIKKYKHLINNFFLLGNNNILNSKNVKNNLLFVNLLYSYYFLDVDENLSKIIELYDKKINKNINNVLYKYNYKKHVFENYFNILKYLIKNNDLKKLLYIFIKNQKNLELSKNIISFFKISKRINNIKGLYLNKYKLRLKCLFINKQNRKYLFFKKINKIFKKTNIFSIRYNGFNVYKNKFLPMHIYTHITTKNVRYLILNNKFKMLKSMSLGLLKIERKNMRVKKYRIKISNLFFKNIKSLLSKNKKKKKKKYNKLVFHLIRHKRFSYLLFKEIKKFIRKRIKKIRKKKIRFLYKEFKYTKKLLEKIHKNLIFNSLFYFSKKLEKVKNRNKFNKHPNKFKHFIKMFRKIEKINS